MATGVFGLRKVYIKQNENIDNRNFASWPESAVYGYFAGAFHPTGSLCTISRLDFSNETVSDPGKNLPTARYSVAACSSSLYGYFGGGAPVINTITRLDFSNETVSDPGKNLSVVRFGSAACSSGFYGYFGGGGNPGSPPFHLSTISRIDFSNETVSDPGKNLPTAIRYSAVAVNSYYGYFGGSYLIPATYSSAIFRLDLSTETINSPGKNLLTIRSNSAAVSNNSFGYFGGGNTPTTCTITRLDFSSETISDPGRNLPSRRQDLAGTSSNSCGYFGGGYFTPTPVQINIITRLDFSSETVSDPNNNFPSGRNSTTALSGGQSINRGSKTYGYYGGGYRAGASLPWLSSIVRQDFSTEVTTLITPKLPSTRGHVAAVSNNYYGYFGGGYRFPVATWICTISRLDFSNETTSDPGKNLPTIRGALATISNNNYGFFGGGSPTPTTRICTITRLDFSNETVSDPGKNLSSERRFFSGTSSTLYGYFGGGSTSPTTVINTISRFDFSTESVVDLPTATAIPSQITQFASVSNNRYGYFGGGVAPLTPLILCTITRLDFITESVNNLSSSLLTTSRFGLTGTSSSFYGYFGGGYTPPNASPASTISLITRLDFSSETVNNPGNNLPHGRAYGAAGLSNSN